MRPIVTHMSGLLHLKKCQDEELPPDEAYVRYAAKLPFLNDVVHDEDEPTDSGSDAIHVIVCMSKDSSQHLLKAQFLQSNIGFKRIVGFQEFELGGKDPGSRTGKYILESSHYYETLTILRCCPLSLDILSCLR